MEIPRSPQDPQITGFSELLKQVGISTDALSPAEIQQYGPLEDPSAVKVHGSGLPYADGPLPQMEIPADPTEVFPTAFPRVIPDVKPTRFGSFQYPGRK